MATPVPFQSLAPGGEDAQLVRNAIDRVVRSGWFVLGPEVEAFEREFAAAAGAAHVEGHRGGGAAGGLREDLDDGLVLGGHGGGAGGEGERADGLDRGPGGEAAGDVEEKDDGEGGVNGRGENRNGLIVALGRLITMGAL